MSLQNCSFHSVFQQLIARVHMQSLCIHPFVAGGMHKFMMNSNYQSDFDFKDFLVCNTCVSGSLRPTNTTNNNTCHCFTFTAPTSGSSSIQALSVLYPKAASCCFKPTRAYRVTFRGKHLNAPNRHQHTIKCTLHH